MPGLVREASRMTSTDKLLPSLNSSQEEKLLVKWSEDLTLKGKSYLPYWNESCKILSNELLSHTKTDWRDLGLIGLNGSVSNLTVKSWFSTKQIYLQNQKSLKISSPSYTASQIGSMASENISLRSKKIQIYPDTELKKTWNKWLAATRFCFNKAIEYQRENGKRGRGKLRNIIMQYDLPEWVKDTPCHIRQNAIFDAHQAYTASGDCKFRNCHAPRQTIKFNNSNYRQGRWYPNLTKKLNFTTSEPIPNTTRYASQLIKLKTGEWFAVFLEEVKPSPSNSEGAIALDPGVRTFLTGFDGQKFLEIGKGDMGKITRLCQHLDNLMSRIAKSQSSRQRKKMRLAAAKMRQRIRNLVDECHKQTANFLVKNYKVIFLPKFETSQMTDRKKRKIRTKTARAMLTWAHYRFKQVLKNKAVLSGCYVVDVTEEFTSKTCTKCGHVHTKLGGSKSFKCPECGHQLDRDWNGALGIMLKALRDTSIVIHDNAIVVQYDNMSCCIA